MTKKILHILALAFMLCSCVKEVPEVVYPYDELGVEHDGKVTLGFNVDIDEPLTVGTKALAETPAIQNIYVAVFDASGYKLSEYVKANPITTGPLNDHKYQFTVELKTSTKARILHFIANGPSELRFGTEQEVIGELYTKYDADESDEYSRKDAYWQRLVFSKISPRPEGSDDGSQEWQDYNSMVSSLSNLKLIRNFSKVTLSKREPVAADTQLYKDFQILGMWFVNYPDRGSIAPYNRNTGEFGTDLSYENKTYLEYANVADVEDKDKGNYQGFTNASTVFLTPSNFVESGDDKNMIDASSNEAVGYVYERERALTSPMYLIIKCLYDDNPCYYKIAMQDEEGTFYAMLRNFIYNVQIQDVKASGYSNAAAALAGAPTGDISVNIDYQDLPNISDGSARMTVSATKLLIVGQTGNSTTASFWYKYEPDIVGHEFTGVHNGLATGNETSDKATPHVVISYEGSEGSTGAAIDNISVATSDSGGNRNVTINTTVVSATPKTQTITITGRRWDEGRYKTITRAIQLVLRDALDMTVSASPNTDSDNAANILNAAGQSVILHIGIEQDLPSSVFPLYFKIEPTVKSLTPDNAHSSEQELPVRYGTDTSGRPTYWFEKAVSLTEYENAGIVNGKKEIPVYFTTLYGDSSNSNATTVAVSNEIFVQKTVGVKNFTAAHFTDLSSTPSSGTQHKVGLKETFSFKVDKAYNGEITFKMKGLEPASSSGLVFKETDASGNRVYTKTVDVTSGATISFDVIPYVGGSASIKLSAFLFEDKSFSEYVIDDSLSLYINSDGTGDGTSFLQITSQKVNGDNLVRGMKATMTIYIANAKATGTVTVGGTTFTKQTSDTSVPEFTAYNGTYTAPNTGDISAGFTDTLIIKVADEIIGSVSVPVYGIKMGDKLTSVSFDTAKYYIIQNNSTKNYLYNRESTTSANQILKDSYDFSSLVKFGNTSSTSNVAFVKIASDTQYYLGSSGNTNVQLNSTPYSWTITDTFRFSRNSSRYIYDNNSGTILINNSNTTSDNRYWNIYPVSFVAP